MTMEGDNIRGLLDRTVNSEPAEMPAAADDVARGRRALRRRRIGAAIVAFCGAAFAAGLAASAVPHLSTGETSYVHNDAATPTSRPTAEPMSGPSAEQTKRSTRTPGPTRSADGRPGLDATYCPRRPPGMTAAQHARMMGPCPLPFVDVIGGHLGDQYEPRAQSVHGTAEGPRMQVVWGVWREGTAEGTVVVGILQPDPDIDRMAAGPDGEPCALNPAKSFGEGFHWTSCDSTVLPDGSTLRSAEGRDPYASALGASLIREDGTQLSIAVSTASFERSADDPPTAPALEALPLTAETLRAVVTDPRMFDDS
jgi:hypothetical protein